jgi:tetratricopeptide (TPR) repeat protein
MRVYPLIIILTFACFASFSCNRSPNGGHPSESVEQPLPMPANLLPTLITEPQDVSSPIGMDPMRLFEGPRNETLDEIEKLVQTFRRSQDRAPLARAEQLLEKGLQKEPKNDRYWAAKGLIANEKLNTYTPEARPDDLAKQAALNLEKALSFNPDNRTALFEIGRLHELNGDFRQAAVAFKKMHRLDPENMLAVTHIAQNLVTTKQFDEAVSYLSKALEDAAAIQNERGRQDIKVTIQTLLAQAYAEMGRKEEAETILERSVETTDKNDGPTCAFVALGTLYAETGRFEQAAKTLQIAAEKEPHNTMLQKQTAMAFFRTGDLEQALPYAERFSSQEPGPESERFLARIKQTMEQRKNGGLPLLELVLKRVSDGEFEAAGKDLKHVDESDLDRRIVVIKGFVAIFQRDYEIAMALFRAAGETASQVPDGDVGLAHLAIIRKQFSEAEKLFKPVVVEWGKHVPESVQPKNANQRYDWFIYKMACLGMGWVLSDQALHAEAIPYFNRILDKQPDDTFSLLGKANALAATDDLDGAEKLARRVLDADKENPYALALLALVRVRKGDDSGAEIAFRKAASVGPEKYTCPFEGLGILYMKQGKLDRAKENFEKAIEMNPKNEYKKFNGLARIYIKEGRVEEAKKLLRQSIENYPYDSEAREMLDRVERTGAVDG